MPKSMVTRKLSRREVLQRLAAGAGIVVALPGRTALSAEAHLDVKDPSAVAVGYVEDAAKVDAQQHPTYSKGSSCANCLQLQGADGASYRPCSLFPGKLVAAAGWCSAWTAEI